MDKGYQTYLILTRLCNTKGIRRIPFPGAYSNMPCSALLSAMWTGSSNLASCSTFSPFVAKLHLFFSQEQNGKDTNILMFYFRRPMSFPGPSKFPPIPFKHDWTLKVEGATCLRGGKGPGARVAKVADRGEVTPRPRRFRRFDVRLGKRGANERIHSSAGQTQSEGQ